MHIDGEEIVIPERTYRRDSSRVLASMNSWLRELLEKSGISATLSISKDGWFLIRSEDAKFIVALLNRIFHYKIPEKGSSERLCKLHKVGSDDYLVFNYPDDYGGTLSVKFPIDKFLKDLGIEFRASRRDILRELCIVEGLPMKLDVSSLRVSQETDMLYKDLFISGLDAIIILEVTPMEADTIIASKAVRDNIVDVKALTPLSYILKVKIGVEPSSVRASILEVLKNLALTPPMAIVRWESLERLMKYRSK